MAFFGLFGSPKSEPVKTEPPLNKPGTGREQAGPIVASFARNPYGGHPAAGLTPAALAIILRSSIDGSPQRYLELAEDMEERFWQYGSTLSTRKRAVSRLEIRVKPAGDEQADLDEAELVREVVQGAAFKAVFIDMLDAIGKSFSAVEIIWDTDTKPWKPVAFKYRDPRFFEFDRHDPEKLGLKADAAFNDIVTAAAAAIAALATVAQAAGLKVDAGVDEVVAAMAGNAPMSVVTSLQAEVKTLKETLEGKGVDDVVSAALKAGKIAPAQEAWARTYAKANLAGFNAFVENQPQLTKVQLGDREVPANQELDANAIAAAAQLYQDEQAKLGRTVTMADAVTHVEAEQAKAKK